MPIVFCYGEREFQEGNRFYNLIAGVHNVFEYGRRNHAPWSLAVHPDSEHENSQSRQLALRFFDTMIPMRLPDPADPNDSIPNLESLPVKKHWIGLNSTFDIMEESMLRVPVHETSYLINKSFGQDLESFCKNGEIRDNSPPPSPLSLRVDQEKNQTTLQWNAFADVESGIQSFLIYRKGQIIGEIAGKLNRRWNPTGAYKAWNYSDQPLEGQELPPMIFVDRDANNAQAEDYQITTVNKAGLESKRTQGIRLSLWNQRLNTPWTNLSNQNFLQHWQGPGSQSPKGWRFEDNILNMSPDRDNGQHTSLFSKEIYEDFEFQFQYRIGLGGNSGIKYRMQDYDGQYLGPEYQILDDQQHYPGYNPATSPDHHYITATLYVLEMGDWNMDARHPPGTWNEGKIISAGNKIEHWINGVKIVDTRTHTKQFKEAIHKSKFKQWPHYGQNTAGRIMLQDHGTGVEFKNLKIKRLKN